MTELTWVVVPREEVEAYYLSRCDAKRSPRGTITCEQDKRRHADFHAGRNVRGAWFTWPLEVGK